MASYSQLIASELAASFVEVSPRAQAQLPRCYRWSRKSRTAPSELNSVNDAGCFESSWDQSSTPQPPTPPVDMVEELRRPRQQRPSTLPSYILQHYHSTGCCGGAFSWRAAMLDPKKDMFTCVDPREYRRTTMQDIQYSLQDKRRGGGPRVGPFQETIPGNEWYALPKYDFTTGKRSTAFNERMHVEWENHVDHILSNGGELPVASVVAKAGFRSCAPCCRDMLALARPTGKTFIMVDLAENDARGTFHFVTGSQYLPVPKEACTRDEVSALKKIVGDAQEGKLSSSDAIYEAVMSLNVPIDEVAQSMYLGDKALLPEGCGSSLNGNGLLEVLHAEHFARLPAEYGASILRDSSRPHEQKQAVLDCRERAKRMLVTAWLPHLQGMQVDLEAYAAAAVAPLLPEDPILYMKWRSRPSTKQTSAPWTQERQLDDAKGTGKKSLRWKSKKLQGGGEHALPAEKSTSPGFSSCVKHDRDDDQISNATASTTVPDDGASTLVGEDEWWLDAEDPEM